MANFRQIHVSIWKDPWFLDLEPNEKLLFIYLFSNESASLAGIYELAFKVICFETSLPAKYVKDTLEKFEKSEKVFFRDGIVWVKNLRKYNGSSSDKVQKRIKTDIALIPECELKQKYISYYGENIAYAYHNDTLSNEEKRREEKSNESEEEVEDAEPQQPFAELSVAFVNETQIPELTGGTQKWVEAINEMVKAGITVNDLVTGIRELRSKPKYKIAGPWSVINAAVIAMSSRLAHDNPSAYPSTKAALEEMGYVIRE